MGELEKRFDAYIKRTIINTVIDYGKEEKKQRAMEISLETIEEKDVSVPFLFSIYDNLEDYFENEKLYTIISNLNGVQKKVLEMRILYQCSYKEIADELCKSESRIRSIYSEAIKKIKKELEG